MLSAFKLLGLLPEKTTHELQLEVLIQLTPLSASNGQIVTSASVVIASLFAVRNPAVKCSLSLRTALFLKRS